MAIIRHRNIAITRCLFVVKRIKEVMQHKSDSFGIFDDIAATAIVIKYPYNKVEHFKIIHQVDIAAIT